MDLTLKIIEYKLSVCKIIDLSQVDYNDKYFFISKTDEEISLVCSSESVPDNVTQRDDGWRAFKIQGILDFSLIGILSDISSLLADAQIGIFAISTYNTDYILTKERDFDRAIDALENNGYSIEK